MTSKINSFLTTVEKRLEAARPKIEARLIPPFTDEQLSADRDLIVNARDNLKKAVKALRVALHALEYCSKDDDMAVDPAGKFDSSSANEWKKNIAHYNLEQIESILGEK